MQSQYQKLHGLCRSSTGSVREGLLSLEERFAADKKEVYICDCVVSCRICNALLASFFCCAYMYVCGDIFGKYSN